MKKLIATIVSLIFLLTCTAVSLGFAEEGDQAPKETATASGAAETAANAASGAGISTTLLEGSIFAAGMALMATAISSGSDETRTPTAHAHGH